MSLLKKTPFYYLCSEGFCASEKQPNEVKNERRYRIIVKIIEEVE